MSACPFNELSFDFRLGGRPPWTQVGRSSETKSTTISGAWPLPRALALLARGSALPSALREGMDARHVSHSKVS